jgi:hypothetical protein
MISVKGLVKPSGLLVEARKIMSSFAPSLFLPLSVTVVLMIFIMVYTLTRLRHMEWNVRNTH